MSLGGGCVDDFVDVVGWVRRGVVWVRAAEEEESAVEDGRGFQRRGFVKKNIAQ